MPDDGAPADVETIINDLYKRLVRDYSWSLKDIDETNLETLFDFLLLSGPEDDSTRVIGGQTYKRAEPGTAPAWL